MVDLCMRWWVILRMLWNCYNFFFFFGWFLILSIACSLFSFSLKDIPCKFIASVRFIPSITSHQICYLNDVQHNQTKRIDHIFLLELIWYAPIYVSYILSLWTKFWEKVNIYNDIIYNFLDQPMRPFCIILTC